MRKSAIYVTEHGNLGTKICGGVLVSKSRVATSGSANCPLCQKYAAYIIEYRLYCRECGKYTNQKGCANCTDGWNMVDYITGLACGQASTIPCTNSACNNGKVQTTVSCGHSGASGPHPICSAGKNCSGGQHD